MVVVITLLAVGCSLASAQLVSPTVYDRTFYGYCNGEHMVLQKQTSSGAGASKVFVAGYEDLTSACGLPYNGNTVGQKHAVNAKVYPHAFTGVNGTYLDIASSADDAICVCFSNTREEWIMDVRNNVGAGYFSEGGFDGDYLFTIVYLSNGLPAHNGNAVGKPVLASSKTNKMKKK